MLRYIFCTVIIFSQTFVFSQTTKFSVFSPKREVRAAWVATVMGLDWPRSENPTEQKRSLQEIVLRLKEANFNTIFFQVRGRADAMYRSQYEPWAQQLTGAFGQDPGWDPLEFIIEQAHNNGMELHAWFNTFLAKSGSSKPPMSQQQHVVLQHPQWVYLVNGEWWFDPGNPEVRKYILNVSLDVVKRYDIDGIQFDFIRYPGKLFPDEATYRQYERSLPKDEWRRENINKFVRAFHDSVLSIKPMLKIGATPIGIYTNIYRGKGQQSYSDLFQDSRRWLREGVMDYLVPQVYWTASGKDNNPDFSTLTREWSNNSFGRHVYIGVGAYKPEVFNQLPSLIDITREAGAGGNSFFRYDNINKALDVGGRYRYLANIPPMLWKDSVPPNPPQNVHAVNITDGIFKIFWEKPTDAVDGDGAKYFNIYRSTVMPVDVNNPYNLIRIVPSYVSQMLDTISRVSAAKYYYAVSSIDKSNNESSPAIESVIIPEIVELSKQYRFDFKLGSNYPNPASSIVFIPYEVKETSPVILKILDNKNVELITVVDAVQPSGRYIAATNIAGLEDGAYSYLLVVGNFSEKKIFRVNN